MRRYKIIAPFYVQEDDILVPCYHPPEEWLHNIKDTCVRCKAPMPLKGRILRYTERGNWCSACDRYLVHKQRERLRLLKLTGNKKLYGHTKQREDGRRAFLRIIQHISVRNGIADNGNASFGTDGGWPFYDNSAT